MTKSYSHVPASIQRAISLLRGRNDYSRRIDYVKRDGTYHSIAFTNEFGGQDGRARHWTIDGNRKQLGTIADVLTYDAVPDSVRVLDYQTCYPSELLNYVRAALCGARPPA